MKNEETTSRSWLRSFEGIDLLLLLIVCSLVVFGLIMVYSSSFIYAQERTGDGFSFIKKQLLFAALGFVALVGALQVDHRLLKKWAIPILVGATTLLALVFAPGVGARVGGAQRWIRLGPINFQPGEIAKFAVIIFVAYQLERKRDRLHTFAAGVVSPFLSALPALCLLLLQPDFGTTVMITLTLFSLLFIAGVPRWTLAGTLALAGAAGAWLAVGTAYRRERLMTFLDPWKDPGGKGFQVLQSMLGVHNGQWSGVGLGNGKEKLFYLPEAHNDFIFAVIGEELGFLGIIAVIATFTLLIYRGLWIAWAAWRRQQDSFGMLVAAGITLALGLQAFVNMSVVLGLLPTKGLPLPFVSYGGSALLVNLFAIGIVLSIGKRSSQ